MIKYVSLLKSCEAFTYIRGRVEGVREARVNYNFRDTHPSGYVIVQVIYEPVFLSHLPGTRLKMYAGIQMNRVLDCWLSEYR